MTQVDCQGPPVSVQLAASCTVRFPPTVDVRSAHALRCLLLHTVQNRRTHLVLDMAAAEALDVTAAAVLVGMHRRLLRGGGRLQLVNVDQKTVDLLRRWGLAPLLAV